MNGNKFVFHMDGVSKTFPGGKKLFENIRLSFLPGVKIGVVGVNGTGKSTLMKIMAGLDKEFIGEAWAANRIKGVRAAVFYNGPSEIIKLSREHNNANILSLGARFMTEDEIYTILEMWFSEPFGGGRHQKRIDKLDQ